MSDPDGSQTTTEEDIKKAMDIIDGYETLTNDIKSIKEFIEKYEKQQDNSDDSQDESQGGDDDSQDTPPPDNQDEQTPPSTPPSDPPPPQTPPPTIDTSEFATKEELKEISNLKEEITKLSEQLTSMTTKRSHTFSREDDNED